ncbi:sensor histidine kinase [Parvibaculum sp.]|uniref:sensor histidine kinase n=1 Tax=Parvibaculum sp. TaxID=2024848 RepID=UPI002FD90711
MTPDDGAPSPVDRTDYSMHRFTMRFRDPEVEDRFGEKNYERQIGITRLSVAGGALVFALFGILDLYVIPEVLHEAWALRFGLVCPVLFGLVAFSYTRFVNHRNSGLLSFVMLIPGFAVVTMTAIADAPGAYLYYAGIIVAVGYSNCLWRLSYVYSSIVSVLVVIAYAWVVVFVNPMPSDILASNLTFLASTIGISVFLNYVQESQFRANFVDNEKLRTEQRRSERLLSRSEAANRAKNDFLAIMSHELRTPLNAIIGFSEIISNQMFGPVGQTKYVDYATDIRSSGAHLLSIINDILDISKAEAGKLQLEEEPIDPVEALNRTMRMFRQRASELGVDLTFRVRDDIPWLIADPRLFNQVAINLTSNALKFTPEDGNVWVELSFDAAGDMVLSVKDTGIGIKASDKERIFEPFVQVEDAMSRTQQGTGLGLPLVRKIMSLHGGRIEIESTVGEGTTAYATFPKSRFVAPEASELSWKAS